MTEEITDTDVPFCTHGRARGMAQAAWGNKGTTSHRTNRRGAFSFSCSSHGGMVIDARCLSKAEYAAFDTYLRKETGTEIYDPATGEVKIFFNPLSPRSRTARSRMSYRHRQAEFFLAEEDSDWAIPAIFAGIHTREDLQRHGETALFDMAIESFRNGRQPSAHELMAAMSRRPGKAER